VRWDAPGTELLRVPEGKGPDEVNRAIVYAAVDQLGLEPEPAKEPIEMLSWTVSSNLGELTSVRFRPAVS
jgi:hypothetical protein